MTTTYDRLVACPECDCLQREVALPDHGSAECVRCGAELYRNQPQSLDRTLAFVLGAAVLFLVANAFPIMSLDAQGLRTSSTITGAAWALHEEGMTSVGLLVFATAVLVPALEVFLLLYLLVPLRGGVLPHGLRIGFRIVDALEPWGMVEVFMLGALVAFSKLRHIATVHPGEALYAMAGFILLLTAAAASFEKRAFWQRAAELGA
jgi:paraquat-inducible protein A